MWRNFSEWQILFARILLRCLLLQAPGIVPAPLIWQTLQPRSTLMSRTSARRKRMTQIVTVYTSLADIRHRCGMQHLREQDIFLLQNLQRFESLGRDYKGT